MSNIHRCGFCGLLTGLLRRVMCAGGSSESCYRELDDQDTLERERTERDTSSSSSDEWDSSDYRQEEHIDDNPLGFSTLKRQKQKGFDLTGPLLDDCYPMKVQLLLSMCSTWEFNTHDLDRATGGHCLPILCMHLFTFYGLIEHFKLLPERCWKLFRSIEDHYNSRNPYHNSIHAADVTQAIHCFLQQKPIQDAMNKMEVMMALLAAIVHDLDHPGVNQSFLVATNHPLAVMRQREIFLEENNPNTYTSRRGTKSLKLQQLIYDLKVAKEELDPDIESSPFKPKYIKKFKKKEIPVPESILELHHWRVAYCCIVESGIFEHMAAMMPGIKCMLKSLIMATDITRQNFYLDEFKRLLENKDLDMEIPDHRHIVLQMALKTADISNPGRPWNISKKWSSSVCEEFYRQGDEELKRNIKVSNLCNRKTDSIPKIQSGFYRYVVMPLYTEWNHYLNSKLSMTMLKNLIRNESKWATDGRTSSYTDPATDFISGADQVENELETSTNISGSSDFLLTSSKSCSSSRLRLPRRGSYSPSKHYKLQEMLRRYSAPLHTYRESRARSRAKKMSVPECRLRKDVLKMAAATPAAAAPAAKAPAAAAPAAAKVEAVVSTEKTRVSPEAGPTPDSVPVATAMTFDFVVHVDSDDDESTLTEEKECSKVVSVIIEESSISSSSRFPSMAPSCSGANGYSADCSSSNQGLIPSLSSARTSSAPCSESRLDRQLEEDIPTPKPVASSCELITYTPAKAKGEEMKDVLIPQLCISDLYHRRRGSAPAPIAVSELQRLASSLSLQLGRKKHTGPSCYKVCLRDNDADTSAADTSTSGYESPQ